MAEVDDIRKALGRVVGGESLDEASMEAAVGAIVDGRCSAAQVGGFLTALHMKGESAEELVAAARALRARAVRVEARGPLLDTCGTGGDGLDTFNVSTAAAFVAAAAGVRVAKHGNRAASGKVGGADVLEALGARIELAPDEAAAALDAVSICFLFAPLYHPAVKQVAAVRRELGFRTLFNLTGPLCNPAGATHQLVGVFAERWLEPMARALASLGGRRAMVVHGSDGSDEVTPVGPTSVVEVGDGRLERYRLEPTALGVRPCRPQDLTGGDAGDNARIVRAALAGRPGPAADAVALNAGVALYVADHAGTPAAGVAAARELMAGGAALARLDAFVAFTRGERA